MQTHSELAIYYYEIVKVRCGFQKGDRKTMLFKSVQDLHWFSSVLHCWKQVIETVGVPNHQGKKSQSFFNSTVPRILGEANGVRIKLQEVEGKKKVESIELCIKSHGLETLMEETILLPLVLGRWSQAAHQENPVRSKPGFLKETKAKAQT